jgi:hypothetical protein
MSFSSDVPDWFVVDYAKPIVEVYIDFVKYSLEAGAERGKLDFLGICGAVGYAEDEAIKHEVKLNPLPSWVPDLRRICYAFQFKKSIEGHPNERVYNADHDLAAEIFITGLNIRVKGFCVCRIESLTPISSRWMDPSQEMQWLESIQSASHYTDNDIARVALLRTLATDVILDGMVAVSRGNAIDFVYEHRDHDSLTPEERMKKQQIRRNMKRFTLNRRLLWTSNGHVGLGPLDAEIGDQICVFYGGQVLYVIRENEQKPGYTFIGECYVDGLMDGEAFELLQDGTAQEEVFVLV